jgi:ribosomal protein L11 methyltransferase
MKNILIMDYLKYIFTLKPDNQDFRDILIATLGEVGFESFVENELTIEAFIKEESFNQNVLDGVDFEPIFEFLFQIEKIPDQNWNEVWEKNYFKPLVIGDQCVIRAPFHTEYPKMEFEIVIEPNMAFGTGNHETTSMMMEYILESKLDRKTVLDMGCGTGILSILSSKCGAAKITSIDIDKWSFEGTSENALINEATNIFPILGDANSIPKEKYDLILANIHKNVIINDLPSYFQALKAEGYIIVSGFYQSDLDDIVEVSKKLGLTLEKSKTNNHWCSACFHYNVNSN